MCLAIPLQVKDLKYEEEGAEPSVAVVAGAGISKEIRLDMVDRLPEPGEYVIVHAGFAIHTLSAEEAEQNLGLLRTMAESLAKAGQLPEILPE